MADHVRVYLCKGDESGWAIDEDRRQTALSLSKVVTLVDDPRDAQVIHSCWWLPLMRLSEDVVRGKPVICHMAGEPSRCFSEIDFLPAIRRVTHWIAQSRHALEQLRDIGASVSHVPYAVDVQALSRPTGTRTPWVAQVREQIPGGAYVIANFHRDAAGAGLQEGRPIPKMVKGPDIFVEILAELVRRGERVVALLAGPRRHWTRRELTKRGVPFVFAGQDLQGDDYPANILDRADMAHLYGMANLVLSCGRSEGGPRAVLEAAAARVAQVATDTGIARDVLAPNCVFHDAVRAVELIQDDIRHGSLHAQVERHHATAIADHTSDANRRRFADVYAAVASRMGSTGSPRPMGASIGKAWATPSHAPKAATRRVCLWNKFTPPPWGGGNQFMLALQAEAQRLGFQVGINGDGMDEGLEYDGHVINSVQFDVQKFESLVKPGDARVVHRIDGPIGLLRGTPEGLEQDRRCFELNAAYATSTVIQSWYTMRALGEMGFSPVKPILVRNACDPAIFARAPHSAPLGDRLKVVATCWSPSPGKGAAIYEWMGWNLPEDEFDLTYVGNCPLKLPRWRVIPPLPSEELAALLHTQDVYITASRNDPCSNALIEALSCGLPALYLESGGHPELTGFGGLGFRRPHEIPTLLRRLRDHHAIYAALSWPALMREVATTYLRLACGDRASGAAQRPPAALVTP
jgi:glycosyltransferase involved in cell wall biosynthesis